MRIKGLTCVGVIFLSLLLILSGYFLSQLYKFQIDSQDNLKKYSMFLNKYKVTRQNSWYNTFQHEYDHQNSVNFEQKGSQLIVDSKYLAQIGNENEHYEQQTISNVLDISPSSKSKKHFIVRSEGNQQLFYLLSTSNPTKSHFIKLEKCLQLDSVQLKDKLHYFVDNLNNFWLISHPHNNVLFVQIYSCEEKKLLRKIFHQPKHNNRKYMINELIEVDTGSQGRYEIKLLTYESHEYIVEIQQQTYQISSTSLNPSHEISSQRIEINQDQQQSLSYKFIDPLNKVFEREFYYLLFKSIQRYLGELKGLLGAFGFDSKQINTFIKEKIKQYEKDADPQHFDYDLQLIDQNNHCILNLQYHLDNQNEKNSSLTKLSKYLIDTRTPIFHNISDYDEYDIVEVLKNEKILSVQQFKRMSTDKGFEKEYTSNYFYSIYHTYPDSKAHFLGVGQKVFYLHPANEGIKNEDYFSVRTRSGGLILQGTQIKGLYEDKPLSKGQVRQKYYIESNQVIPGIWQAHAGYQTLISSVKGNNKVQLINGLSGKTMITYTIDVKQGYQYANSFLFNNEWWIVIFNKNTKMSQLIKYELYVEKAYPKQIDFVRRTYGRFVESEFDQNEDDLALILKEYVGQVSSNNGFVILDIFRCLDQYYYVQICDTKGENYAIVRIHYKRFSNRLPKKSNQYANDLEKRLIVEPKNMVKQTQSLDPFLFVLNGQNLYEGISDLIEQGKFDFSNYSTSNQQKVITSLKKLNQFDFLPYSVISHQQEKSVPNKETTSVQEITLLNMRVLVENAKKKFMIETKVLARNCLMYFTLFIIIILVSLIVKLLIQRDLKKMTQSKQEKSKDKENTNQKGKKKQKLK